MFKWLYKLKYKNKLISNTLIGNTVETDFVMTTKSEYPASFKIKHKVPIRSQGSIGSCCSHSVVRAVEIQMNPKVFIEGSELYHYFMARKFVNHTFPKNKGMTIRDGCITTKKYGFCPEKLWRYKPKDYNKIPTSLAKSFSTLFKHFYNTNYFRVITISDIKKSLSMGIPVVFGLRIDNNFMKCKGNWIPGGRNKGGHAQIITGYDKNYFYIENSWGTRWGLKGRYKAKISDIMKYGFDFFIIKLEQK